MAAKRFAVTYNSATGGKSVTTSAQAGDSGFYLTVDNTLPMQVVMEYLRVLVLDVERRQADVGEPATFSVVPNTAHGY